MFCVIPCHTGTKYLLNKNVLAYEQSFFQVISWWPVNLFTFFLRSKANVISTQKEHSGVRNKWCNRRYKVHYCTKQNKMFIQQLHSHTSLVAGLWPTEFSGFFSGNLNYNTNALHFINHVHSMISPLPRGRFYGDGCCWCRFGDRTHRLYQAGCHRNCLSGQTHEIYLRYIKLLPSNCLLNLCMFLSQSYI